MTDTTLIIADNQPLTALALRTWAEKNELVGSIIESPDQQSLEDSLRELSDENVLLIIDVELFDFSDKDELIAFFQTHNQLRKLFIGDHFNEEELFFIAEEMQSNIVLKSVDLEELRIAVSFALKGRYYIQSELLNLLMRKNAAPVKPENEEVHLTPTEKDIVSLIASGKTTKEVAVIRSLSYHTVVTHRKNIFRKLGVSSIHALTIYAIKSGLIDTTEYYI
ncbi:response regulator transcription factor [uncultured Bacteroides sp.]|uniref:helix-turn-helix transcriptional regulator n=1 Tax=uncultured Bacteroides sp. TaxID=162156 RepID=UPI002AAAA2C1|nr:response regulator transcription factor [uncultured Bacteroides sp.]